MSTIVKKSVLILFILGCFVLIGCSLNGNSSHQETLDNSTHKVSEEQPSANITNDNEEENELSTIILTDNVGRTVELPFPVTRAVVANRYNSELIRACGAIDHVIAVDLNTAQDREYWSNFDPNNTIGKSQTTLNYEKIIDLDTQVLILPANGTYKEAEEKLAPFGIKVFVISGYDTSDFKNQVMNIGKMFDVEKGANEFLAYFNNPLDYIAKSLQGVPKKTVYFETTTDFKTSFPGDYYAYMIDYSGALNIFADAPPESKSIEIDSEEIIRSNPDVIVKNITPETALQGTGVYQPPTEKQMKDSIAAIQSRPGWDEITAVKNNDIYIMTQFGHGGASKLIGAVYMAKWLYPEHLPDLDPHEIFKEWLEKYQGFKNLEGHFYPRP